MAQTPAIDISRWQGNIDETAVPQEIVLMKVGGGDDGLYFDEALMNNYGNAQADGKAIGLYWFAGGGNPHDEAAKFIEGCKPFQIGDVYALDWEIENPDPVGWVSAFVSDVHEATGCYPFVYMDIDRANRFDWSGVFNNCGFWCAAPSYGWNDTLPVHYTVMLQQGPIISDAGVQNPVDSDMFFGTKEQFLLYGYKTPQAAATPTPAPAPVPVEPAVPVQSPAPVAEPPTQATPVPPPVAPVEQPVVAQPQSPDVPAGTPTPESVPPPVSPAPKAQSSTLERVVLGALAALAALLLVLLHAIK